DDEIAVAADKSFHCLIRPRLWADVQSMMADSVFDDKVVARRYEVRIAFEDLYGMFITMSAVINDHDRRAGRYPCPDFRKHEARIAGKERDPGMRADQRRDLIMISIDSQDSAFAL